MKNVEIRARSYQQGRIVVTVINQDDWHDTYTVLISENQEVAAWIPHLGYLVRNNGWLTNIQKQHVKEFIKMPDPVIREIDFTTLQDLVRFAHNGMPGERILKLFHGDNWKESEFGKKEYVKADEPFVSKVPMDLSAWTNEE